LQGVVVVCCCCLLLQSVTERGRGHKPNVLYREHVLIQSVTEHIGNRNKMCSITTKCVVIESAENTNQMYFSILCVKTAVFYVVVCQHSATPFKHDLTHCNTLQHAATHCNTLQHTATHCNTISARCNTLQHTVARCNALQHTATHCSIL